MAKHPTKHRAEWTNAIIADLKRMVKDRHPVKAIAKALSRTEAAIRKKGFDLGLSFKRPSKAAKKAAKPAKKSAKKAAKKSKR
ncbi:MAG: hypothetical protein U1E67_21830 [Hyphomicrobiales bacterium]